MLSWQRVLHLVLGQIGPEASLRLHDVVAQPLLLPHDGGGPLTCRASSCVDIVGLALGPCSACRLGVQRREFS